MAVARMEQTMRWFGPRDTVPLAAIREAGCSGVVTALHDVPVGEVWSLDHIEGRKRIVEAAGLTWSVVESLPVHEDIKSRSNDWRRWIDNYKDSLRNLAESGVGVVTYNFMPVLDWVRTDVGFLLPDGRKTLRFERLAFAVFDQFIIQRPGAPDDYDDQLVAAAEARFRAMSGRQRDTLARTVMLGLPGSDDAFTPDGLLSQIAAYRDIGPSDLSANLFEFIAEVAPVAADCGVKLAIHPDDPPFPVLGLPRVVSTQADARAILAASAIDANGLCFCTGSYGARPDNPLRDMLEEFQDRVHFLHLRNTKRDDAGNFHEAGHLEGDAPMSGIVADVLKIMARREQSLPMRPDHGLQMMDDHSKPHYPGYSAIGRMRGLAELRGLEEALVNLTNGR